MQILILFNLKKNLIFFGIFLWTSSLTAQIYRGTHEVSLTNFRPILSKGSVVGYYAFYQKEKANSQESIYVLEMLDANLNYIRSVEIKKSNSANLIDAAFNGTNFCFAYLKIIGKKGSLMKMPIYSTEYQITDEKGNEIANYVMEQSSTTADNLIGVEKEGFVKYTTNTQNGNHFEIEMLDNFGRKKWVANSGQLEKKLYETARPYYADSNMVISYITTKAKIFSANINCDMLFTNTSDGKEIAKFKMENERGLLLPMGVRYNHRKKHYILFGEYFKKTTGNERFSATDRIGFFMYSFDFNGNIVSKNHTEWATDIAAVLPIDTKGRMEGKFSVYIHDVIHTDDEKYFLIGEQFKKSVDVVGLLAESNSFKITLGDLLFFEMDTAFKAKKVDIIEKDPTKIPIPDGYGNSLGLAGLYLKNYDLFDYRFTQVAADEKKFISTYLNFDREKEDKKYIIGNIGYKNGKLESDQIPLTTKPTNFSVLPGKIGYVVIYEYFKTLKEVNMRLEKLDF